MDKEAILVELRDKYRDRDWFYDAGYDQYGRPTVYIKFDCHETIWDIPDTIHDKQLLVHYAASIQKNDLVNKPQQSSIIPAYTAQQFIDLAHEANKKGIDTGFGQMATEEEIEAALEESVQALTNELDRLEKICGSNILADIFFETHDKHNAVTNLSDRYPEVRKAMDKIYDRYGFNIVYEELEL